MSIWKPGGDCCKLKLDKKIRDTYKEDEMDLGIAGKRAAVAASSQGLGFACALELAREGASVAICSRDGGRITAAADRIRGEVDGAQVHTSVVDVAHEDDCVRFVETAVKAFGGLDILVTNSGGPTPGALDQVGIEDIRAGFDSTLMSAVVMMKTAAAVMRRGGWGRIVNILSMTVKQPKTNLLVSNTMRPGILGFAKSISRELAADGITVNNVAPGYTKTERLDELAGHLADVNGTSAADVFAGWEAAIPARRLGRPEELAAVVAFLASERAAFVNGVTVQVDGGEVQSIM
jgi:3-oxoacyl-[acyl-carrier protein] reductase